MEKTTRLEGEILVSSEKRGTPKISDSGYSNLSNGGLQTPGFGNSEYSFGYGEVLVGVKWHEAESPLEELGGDVYIEMLGRYGVEGPHNL